MPRVRLSHILPAIVLWCAAAFAFSRVCFISYDGTAAELQMSGVKEALGDLKRVLQAGLDRGEGLPHLKNAAAQTASYKTAAPEMIAMSVFDYPTGKVLFGERAGGEVPVEWYEKCRLAESYFIHEEKSGKAVGTPVINAFGETAGCAVAEYKTRIYENGRKSMVSSAVKGGAALAFAGIFATGILYVLAVFRKKVKFFRKPMRLTGVFAGIVLISCSAFPFLISSVFSSFEDILKDGIAYKTGTLARMVRNQVVTAVENGIPFQSLRAVEPYLDSIRQKHPEIVFILLTDKSGRVLYESGSAVQAFESDAATGRVALRKGYFNAAEPVSVRGKTEGWVQIGVNERFVREKIY